MCLLVLNIVLFTLMNCVLSKFHYDYCVIGAGPSGLQMGYFLKRAGRDYVIFERESTVGSFFIKYPRHDTLISINKRFTGKSNTEFNLRHDWNSLISDDETLRFGRYSKEYFPHRRDLLRYLSDYHTKLGLNVQFNTNISNIERHVVNVSEKIGVYFTMMDQHRNRYTCRLPIIATGIAVPNNPPIGKGGEFVEGYEDVSINGTDFEGQTVLILGRGNSAFEVANSIYGHTNLVHMVGRSRVRHAWSTHYVGDLRAVNNELLDTYQLKSLDAVLEAHVYEIEFLPLPNGRLRLSVPQEDVLNIDNFALREPYDRVIRCLGFKYDPSIFSDANPVTHSTVRAGKFPDINHNYESKQVPGVFFVGPLTHSLDFRKSAGGFIHGFRYTARALHRLLEWRNHKVPWPSTDQPITDLLNTVLRRVNEASGIYQMFQTLCDIYLFKNSKSTFALLEEFPVNLVPDLEAMTGHRPVEPTIVMCMEYGANFSGPGKDVFRDDRAHGDAADGILSNFLHPVFYYYEQLPSHEDMKNKAKWMNLPLPDKLHHVLEDFLTSFDARSTHVAPLRRFFENCTDTNLRQFYADFCFKAAFSHSTLPANCRPYIEQRGYAYFGNEELINKAFEAGLMNL